MKIGIITIHNSPNYGASLQSYALWKYITDLGCNCEVIDLYRPVNHGFRKSWKYRPFIHKKGFQYYKTLFRYYIYFFCKNGHKIVGNLYDSKFQSFNSQISFTTSYRSVDELYENPPVFDIYITGSDQVWNPTQPFCIEPYFLTFVKNKNAKKISFASSVGIDFLYNKEKKYFQKWLKSYDLISVREQTGKELLSRIVDKPVYRISDPTFLFDFNQWKKECSPVNVPHKYILLFTLNYQKELADYCCKLSEESGIPLLYLCRQLPSFKESFYRGIVDAGPREFLSYIANADLMVTDSFHGTAFALHLKTNNIYTYIKPTNKRGSRIYDLYNSVNIKEHILSENLDMSYFQLMSTKLNIDEIQWHISNIRKECQDFLLKGLQL